MRIISPHLPRRIRRSEHRRSRHAAARLIRRHRWDDVLDTA